MKKTIQARDIRCGLLQSRLQSDLSKPGLYTEEFQKLSGN